MFLSLGFMFYNDRSLCLLKLVEISLQIETLPKGKKTKLTPEHLNTFKDIFKSIAQLKHPELLNDRIFTDLDNLIQNYDATSPEGREKLFHLSKIILHNFSSKSANWIHIIYKRIMSDSTGNMGRFTCLDLTRDIPKNDDPVSQYQYAFFLFQMLNHHINQ